MPNLENLEVDDFLDAIREGWGSELPLAYWQFQGRCPNGSTRLGGFAPNPNCPLCGGTGVLVYRQELPIQNQTGGRVLLSNVVLGRTKAPIELEAGDAILTYNPEDYAMNGLDRVVFESRYRTANQLIVRGGGSLDKLNPRCLKRVLALTLPTGPITHGFQANPLDDGITWTDDDVTPVAGTPYTVFYEYYPIWQVMEDSHSVEDRDIHNRPLPRDCVLRIVKFAATDGAFSLAGT